MGAICLYAYSIYLGAITLESLYGLTYIRTLPLRHVGHLFQVHYGGTLATAAAAATPR